MMHRVRLTVSLLVLLVPFLATAQVDVNRASASELESLPGVGAATAQRIVEERDRGGPFDSLDDLTRVRGVGPSTVEKMRGLAVAGAGGTGAVGRGAASPAAPDAQMVDRLLARYRAEPSINAVQVRAMHYAEVHPELIASWRTRASWRAALPQVRAEYRRNLEEDSRQVVEPGSPIRQQFDLDDDDRYVVRAAWDLDELVFNSDELRVSSEAVRLVKLREDVLTQVTKLYFERRRLQVERDLSPSRDLASALRREMRLAELTAQIDALTGGWFSAELAKAAGGQ